MPIYTYRCTECDHEFETRQRMTDDPLTECPKCGGKIRRVVNSVGVVFKGKGFYVTDNRGSAAQAPTASTDKKEESRATAGDSSSSDAKSENKGGGSSESKTSADKKSKPAA